MEKAITLAIRHGVSGYDAQYMALAEALGILLISEDKKLQRAFPQRVISLAQARERFLNRRSSGSIGNPNRSSRYNPSADGSY
jgi:hypothetical protein